MLNHSEEGVLAISDRGDGFWRSIIRHTVFFRFLPSTRWLAVRQQSWSRQMTGENLLHENQARGAHPEDQRQRDYYVRNLQTPGEEAAETRALVLSGIPIGSWKRNENPEGTCRKRTDSQVFLFRYSWKKQRQFMRISIWHSVTAGLIPMF